MADNRMMAQMSMKDGFIAALDQSGGSTPGALRQLGDPLYARKANALYYEFEEIGMNRQLGYTSPADLIDKYPAFYWNSVAGHLDAATTYLNATVSGQQWIAHLHNHVFCAEHSCRLMGPQS